jgi:hypothetical protein
VADSYQPRTAFIYRRCGVSGRTGAGGGQDSAASICTAATAQTPLRVRCTVCSVQLSLRNGYRVLGVLGVVGRLPRRAGGCSGRRDLGAHRNGVGCVHMLIPVTFPLRI